MGSSDPIAGEPRAGAHLLSQAGPGLEQLQAAIPTMRVQEAKGK